MIYSGLGILKRLPLFNVVVIIGQCVTKINNFDYFGTVYGRGCFMEKAASPMIPNKILLGSEVSGKSYFHSSLGFPKAKFGRIGLNSGNSLQLPWTSWAQAGS